MKPKTREDNIIKIISWKEISHLGFLVFLLGAAPPSPDPPELDPAAAWLSIPPTAKKRLFPSAPKRTTPNSPAAGTDNPRKHGETDSPASRFVGAWKGEARSRGKEVERGKAGGLASRLAKVTRKGGGERFDSRREGVGGREREREVAVVVVLPASSYAGGDDQGESKESKGSCVILFFSVHFLKRKKQHLAAI
jgi:hypothetical protein